MKRFVLMLVLLLALSGCALAPKQQLYVADYVDSSSQTSATDAVMAENYLSLKNAILAMVRAGQTEGVIRVTTYDGALEDDLAQAAYEVSKLDPLGAYAVDYMTHSCAQIVSYYEIRINITFRRTVQQIDQIVSVSTQTQLEEQLWKALEQGDDRLTLRLSSYRAQDQDIPALVAEYGAENPATVMEIPSVSCSVYPESGNVRILEIDLRYQNAAQDMETMRKAVQESIDGAAAYIRYRQTDRDKAQLLFTYLMERFQYKEDETVTPLYDALCGGIADPTGLAQAWQLICDRAGVSCQTVSGMRNNEPYVWNIVSVDGYYRHLDLARCMLELHELVFWTDQEMSSYYWNTELFPACEPLPEPETEEVPEGPEITAPADGEVPEEETTEEPQPDAEVQPEGPAVP